MQAIIQSLGQMVAALAVAAFAHFGVVLKDAPCVRSVPAVQRVSYVRPAAPRTIGRAVSPLARDIRPA